MSIAQNNCVGSGGFLFIIDAIISLSSKLFYGTGIPAAVI